MSVMGDPVLRATSPSSSWVWRVILTVATMKTYSFRCTERAIHIEAMQLTSSDEKAAKRTADIRWLIEEQRGEWIGPHGLMLAGQVLGPGQTSVPDE